MKDINGTIYYGAGEAAKKLGISRAMLNYYRKNNRVRGLPFSDKITLYSEAQLEAVDLESRGKPGPKGPRKKTPQTA
jgi:hypothetical protein